MVEPGNITLLECCLLVTFASTLLWFWYYSLPFEEKELRENPAENQPATQWLTSHPASTPASGYCRSSVY